MPWIVGDDYSRDEIRAWFPELGPRDAVSRNGHQVAMVLLRKNSQDYVNWFERRRLVMEVRGGNREHNGWLRSADFEKVLFWSEAGTDYVCLGRCAFHDEIPAGATRPIYRFDVLDAAAPVPAH